MAGKMKITATLGALALSATSLVSPGAAEEKRELSYSFNVAVTSDYVFRGFSQTSERATGQAGVDLTWGKFYAGLWGSGIDFGTDFVTGRATARAELDLYAGFKPEMWGITFDFGGIYYAYPGARDNRGTTAFDKEADYFELKAGMSREIVKNLTLTSTLFWSPDYTNGTGRVWTTETGAALVLPVIAGFTPTLSALYGYQKGSDARYIGFVGNGENNYTYWNAGVTFAWEKFTFDVRYWDTNISNTGNFCKGTSFQCDDRVMATIKFTY
jgi:uncharacterized protein (TIGR02001 family)